jgi:hypothetical protein
MFRGKLLYKEDYYPYDMERIDVSIKISGHIHYIISNFIDHTRGDGGLGDAMEYGQLFYLK